MTIWIIFCALLAVSNTASIRGGIYVELDDGCMHPLPPLQPEASVSLPSVQLEICSGRQYELRLFYGAHAADTARLFQAPMHLVTFRIGVDIDVTGQSVQTSTPRRVRLSSCGFSTLAIG